MDIQIKDALIEVEETDQQKKAQEQTGRLKAYAEKLNGPKKSE